MSVVSGAAKILRYVAFTLMTLFGLFGGLFAAGYAFADLETWAAVGVTAAMAVPTIVLSVVAFRFPSAAAPWFVGLTGAVVVLTMVNASVDLVDEDSVGPVTAISVLALAVSLAFLGLHRSALAGLLLVVLGLGQLAATLLGFRGEVGAADGPSLGDMLTTSSGVVVVPVLVVGVLFLLAGALSHESLRFWHRLPPTAHTAH